MTNIERIAHAVCDREFLSQCGIHIAEEPLTIAHRVESLLDQDPDWRAICERQARFDQLEEDIERGLDEEYPFLGIVDSGPNTSDLPNEDAANAFEGVAIVILFYLACGALWVVWHFAHKLF